MTSAIVQASMFQYSLAEKEKRRIMALTILLVAGASTLRCCCGRGRPRTLKSLGINGFANALGFPDAAEALH